MIVTQELLPSPAPHILIRTSLPLHPPQPPPCLVQIPASRPPYAAIPHYHTEPNIWRVLLPQDMWQYQGSGSFPKCKADYATLQSLNLCHGGFQGPGGSSQAPQLMCSPQDLAGSPWSPLLCWCGPNRQHQARKQTASSLSPWAETLPSARTTFLSGLSANCYLLFQPHILDSLGGP